VTIQQLLENLWAFVEEPKNKRLKYAVNPSILPFRGRPFGKTTTHEIDKKLGSGEQADVLWFGSNPNAPDSFHRLLWGKPPAPWRGKETTPNDTFEKQYTALKSSKEATQKNWDPIQKPRGGWLHYRNGLARALDPTWSPQAGTQKDGREDPVLNRVVMANAIPWGSHTTDELLDVLLEFDKDLLEQLLLFSNKQVTDMIEALNPKLIIVPFSLAKNKALRQRVDELCIEEYPLLLDPALNPRSRSYTNEDKDDDDKYKTRNFNYFEREKYLYLPHPSSLRIANGGVNHFQDILKEIFEEKLGERKN